MTSKEAIERIKTRFDKWALDNEDMKAIQTLIPELAESEDERIRKELIDFFMVWKRTKNSLLGTSDWRGINTDRIITWLEKQKEQMPSISCVHENDKPAEWSEEDLQHKSWILEGLADGERKMPEYAEDFRAAYKWLKSLRPHAHWKPSEEQMDALKLVILNGSFSYVGQVQDLISLKDELKKL